MSLNLYGYSVADDPSDERSRTGFLDSDKDLLKALDIMGEDGQLAPAFAGTNNTDIRDLLLWIKVKRTPPYPPLLAKKLCKDHAELTRSVAAPPTAGMPRTGQQQDLADLEAILRAGGIADPTTCVSSMAFTPSANPPTAPGPSPSPATATATVPVAGATSSGPCIQNCNCNNGQNVEALLQTIQPLLQMIQQLLQRGPGSASGTTSPILDTTGGTIPVATVVPPQADISEEIRALGQSLQELLRNLPEGGGGVDHTESLNAIKALIEALPTKIDENLSNSFRTFIDALVTILNQHDALLKEIKASVGARTDDRTVHEKLNSLLRGRNGSSGNTRYVPGPGNGAGRGDDGGAGSGGADGFEGQASTSPNGVTTVGGSAPIQRGVNEGVGNEGGNEGGEGGNEGGNEGGESGNEGGNERGEGGNGAGEGGNEGGNERGEGGNEGGEGGNGEGEGGNGGGEGGNEGGEGGNEGENEGGEGGNGEGEGGNGEGEGGEAGNALPSLPRTNTENSSATGTSNNAPPPPANETEGGEAGAGATEPEPGSLSVRTNYNNNNDNNNESRTSKTNRSAFSINRPPLPASPGLQSPESTREENNVTNEELGLYPYQRPVAPPTPPAGNWHNNEFINADPIRKGILARMTPKNRKRFLDNEKRKKTKMLSSSNLLNTGKPTEEKKYKSNSTPQNRLAPEPTYIRNAKLATEADSTQNNVVGNIALPEEGVEMAETVEQRPYEKAKTPILADLQKRKAVGNLTRQFNKTKTSLKTRKIRR